MKRVLLAAGLLVSLGVAQASYGYTFTDSTNYWDGWSSSNAWMDSQDVLGKPSITGGNVQVAQGLLQSISYAADPLWPNGGWNTLHSGDLFINVKGSANDNTWDYIVRTFNANAAGNYALYNITSLGITDVRSDYGALTNPNPNNTWGQVGPYVTAYDRIGQPVALTNAVVSGLTSSTTAYFAGLTDDAFNTFYTFGNGLNVGDSFEIAWGLTCGNDVVQTPVPEPGTMMLLGMGLLGMAVYGKRRSNKQA